jgi:hypothetical protein
MLLFLLKYKHGLAFNFSYGGFKDTYYHNDDWVVVGYQARQHS